MMCWYRKTDQKEAQKIRANIFLEKNAVKDRKRAKYGDRALRKAFR